MSITNIKGFEIDIDKIDNPKLKKVLRHRHKDFMFFPYNDHTDNKYNDHHVDHNEYQERHREKYDDCDWDLDWDQNT